uniref:Uncharacterized protein n=1 Tax=Arion vulgaris TaxID=1028688 RepID=A0A0B7B5W8_9EUPU
MKPQPSKDACPSGTGIKNAHLRTTTEAMQQTLLQYGVILTGQRQVDTTPGSPAKIMGDR